MSLLGNFIGGAAGAGAEIMGDRIKLEDQGAQQEKMARIQSDLQAQREKTRLELARDMGIAEEQRKQSPEYIQAEGAADMEREKVTMGNKRGLMQSQAQLASDTYDAGADLRKKTSADLLAQARAKSDAELEADIKKMNNPAYLAGKAKEARASHIDDGAGLRGLQMQAAQMALDEKKAEAKMPQAVRDLAGSYREQLKSLSATIDKGTLDGTSTPEGIAALERRRAALSADLSNTLAPYLGEKSKTNTSQTESPEPEVKYDAKGNAYVRGPDGKPMLKSEFDKPAKAPKETPAPKAISSGPKAGDTRKVSAGRGQGTRTQVYKATGRSGSSMAWVDQ